MRVSRPTALRPPRRVRVGHLLVLALLLLPGFGAAVSMAAQPPGQIEQQDEFVPISELPPQDQLPAAPLLVTAYAVVVAAFFAYLFSVMRRLAGVQRELERLEADVKRARR
jgi:CcmD family protein